MTPPDDVEEIDTNIGYLKDKNDFLKLLIREQSVANNAVAIPQTYTDMPEFCKESCKSCNCENYYTIEEIQNTAKIGKFYVKIKIWISCVSINYFAIRLSQVLILSILLLF